jgi:hypothetical protein
LDSAAQIIQIGSVKEINNKRNGFVIKGGSNRRPEFLRQRLTHALEGQEGRPTDFTERPSSGLPNHFRDIPLNPTSPDERQFKGEFWNGSRSPTSLGRECQRREIWELRPRYPHTPYEVQEGISKPTAPTRIY